MKFLPKTMQIMKHFASINESLLITPGKSLATLSETKSVYARADVPQEFDQQIGIFDLHRFFGVYSLFEDPEAEVDERSITLQGDGKVLKYTLADPRHIKAPPADKSPKLPSEDVTVQLPKEALVNVLKAAGSLGMPEIAFVHEKGRLTLETYNGRNPTSDSFSVVLGQLDEGKQFKIAFKVENIRVVPADYRVVLSYGKRSMWYGTVYDDVEMMYMIAGEDTSRIG